MMQDKIVELESLRGLAALGVVLAHIPPWVPAVHDITFARNAGAMVEFFFVLSGFVIAMTYGGRIQGLADAARFQFLRLGRLYPVHLLFLLVVAGFEFIKLLAVADPISPAFAPGITGPREFIENLLLIQSLGFAVNPASFNGPSRTISTEVSTYALFALLLLIAPRRHMVFQLGIVLVTATLLAAAPAAVQPFERLLLCLCGFFTGCLVANLSQRVGALPAALGPLALLALVALISAFRFSELWHWALVFPIAALLVLGVANGRESIFKRALRTPVLTWLGLISYSVYMAHYSVIYAVDTFMRRVLKAPTELFYNQPVVQFDGLAAVAAYVGLYVAVVAVAATTFYLVERPARLWSRRVAYTGRWFGEVKVAAP